MYVLVRNYFWLTSKHEYVRVWFVQNETFLLCLVDQERLNVFALTAKWQRPYVCRESGQWTQGFIENDFDWLNLNSVHLIFYIIFLYGHNANEYISSHGYTLYNPIVQFPQISLKLIVLNRFSRPKICQYNRLAMDQVIIHAVCSWKPCSSTSLNAFTAALTVEDWVNLVKSWLFSSDRRVS